jgi:hypothetical protein
MCITSTIWMKNVTTFLKMKANGPLIHVLILAILYIQQIKS